MLITPPNSTAHAGKGYATEALRAYLSAYFAHVPSPSVSNGLGYDYVQAETDQDNIASQRILQKCGFQHVETIVNGFESPILGLRDTVIYRIARPGMSLESLEKGKKAMRWLEKSGRAGNVKKEQEFVPPVQ
jgi:RimJ/RimL family protein N-acetyltransferase